MSHRIELTAEQSIELFPLLSNAYAGCGAVFAQIRRGKFPDHERVFVDCHRLDAETAKRLRAFLDKEAARRISPPLPSPIRKAPTLGVQP